MNPTLSFSFSNPLRKGDGSFDSLPEPFLSPALPATGYRNRTTHFVHECPPSFGLSFGFVQLDCPRDTWGTWRVSGDCIVIAYERGSQKNTSIC